MSKKVDYNKSSDSQHAIRDYIQYKTGHDDMHKARVLISSKGRAMYNGILDIIPSIETNSSFVRIIGDAQFESDYYEKYTNEYQLFTFIQGTLLIKCEDRWGNPIEIDITGI